MNVARYMLPHLLCLSTTVLDGSQHRPDVLSEHHLSEFSANRIPREFRSWNDFSEVVDVLVKTGCIPDGSKIWWDIRPNWNYPTLEICICDVCTRVDEGSLYCGPVSSHHL